MFGVLGFGFGFGFCALNFGIWVLDLCIEFRDLCLRFGFCVLGFGFWIWVLDFGFLDFGLRSLGSEFWVLGFWFWILSFGFRVLGFGLGFWHVGFGFGFWILGFGLGGPWSSWRSVKAFALKAPEGPCRPGGFWGAWRPACSGLLEEFFQFKNAACVESHFLRYKNGLLGGFWKLRNKYSRRVEGTQAGAERRKTNW